MKVLKWLIINDCPCNELLSQYYLYASNKKDNGFLEMLKWVSANLRKQNVVSNKPAKKDHTGRLKWAISNGYPCDKLLAELSLYLHNRTDLRVF